MPFRSPLDTAQSQIAAQPTGARGALDFSAVRRAGDQLVEDTARNESTRTSALKQVTQTAQPTQSKAKLFFNPTSKQYFVAGKEVPARYDTLKYLSEAEDLPELTEAPAGYVPMSQNALKMYVAQIRNEMEGTPMTQFWDSLKSGTGDVVAGIPRMLGWDWKNNLADEAKDSYAEMSLREQAGADEGAFDSLTGFVNSAASGLGSATPAIGGGIAGSLVGTPALGLGIAASVGFSQASGADSAQSQSVIAQALIDMSDEDRREASPSYAALRDHGMAEELAIEQVAFDASRAAGFVGGLTTLPETLLGGKLVGNILRKIPGAERLVGAAKDAAISKTAGGALAKASEKLANIPAPLRFLARTGAVGGAEGLQEVVENAGSMAAGNAAAGVGSTNPLDFVNREDFEGGAAVGLIFGALGGGPRKRAGIEGSDLEAALNSVTTPPTAPKGPDGQPQGPGPAQPADPQVAAQIEKVLAERFGPQWTENLDGIAMDPRGRQLLGQLMGIAREQEQAASAAQAEVQGRIDARFAPPVDPGAPSLQGPAFGDGQQPPQMAPDAGPPGEIDQRQQAAMVALQQLTGAQTIEEIEAQIPQLEQLAQQEPLLQQILNDSGLTAIPMGFDPEGGPEAVVAAQQAFTTAPGVGPQPRLPTPAEQGGAMGTPAAGLKGDALRARTRGVPKVGALPTPDPEAAPTQAAPDGTRPMGVAPAPLPNPDPMSPEEAAAREQTQLERGAPAPDALPGDSVVPSTPEPAEDIAAQLEALVAPDSQRKAVFVAEGNEDALPDALPKGIRAYSRPGVGVLLTANAVTGKRFQSAPEMTDDMVAKLIGIPKSKADVVKKVAAGDPPVAVQAVNPDGAVAAEALTTKGDALKAKGAVKKQAMKKAVVRVVTPEKVQADRAAPGSKGEALKKPKAPVKLGPKGEAVRAKTSPRQSGRSPGKKSLTKKDDEKKRRVPLDAAQTTLPTEVGKTVTKHEGREIPVPKSLILETGNNDGPVDLLVQTVDDTNRARLQGLLKLDTLPSSDRTRVNEILRAYARLEIAIGADVDAAEKAFAARLEKDPAAKAQYEVELAQAGPVEAGRPNPSPLYAIPLLDVEMREFVDLLQEQAEYELGEVNAGRLQADKSIAMRMMHQIIPPSTRAVDTKVSKEALRLLSELDADSKNRLLAMGAARLRNSTLGKQVVRGATAVANVAGRGESTTDKNGLRALESLTKKNYAFMTAYGDDLPANAAKLVNDWAKLFERKAGVAAAKDLRVMSIAQAKALLPDRPDIRAGLSAAYIKATIDGNPVHIIAVDWTGLPEPVAVESMAHEFGHFISEHIYAKETTQTRAAIQLAHRQWRDATATKSANEIMADRSPLAIAAYMDDSAERSMEYAQSFHEWSADNVARWLLTKKEPKTLVEKYFAKVAAVLRDIYESVIGKGQPDRVWQQVLDAWTQRARAANAISEDLVEHDVDELPEVEISGKEKLEAAGNRADSVRALEALRPMGDAMRATFDAVREGKAREKFSQSSIGDTMRKYGLQLLTTHQIADTYAGTPIGDVLKSLVTIRDRIDAKARDLQETGADALAKALNLSAAVQGNLKDVMYFATYYNVNPEFDIQHPSNKHVLASKDPQVQAEAARRFDKTRNLYLEMTRKDARSAGIYEELRDAFEEMRQRTIKTKIENLEKSGMSIKVLEGLQAKLKALLEEKREGPYFPLMRDGDWIVNAVLPADLFGDGGLINDDKPAFKTKTAATKEANNLKQMYPGAKVYVEPMEGEGYAVRVHRNGVYFFNSEAEALAAGPAIEAEIRDEYRARGENYDAAEAVLQKLTDEEGGATKIPGKPKKKLASYEEDKRAPSDEFLRELRAMTDDAQVSPQFRDALEELYLESLPEYSYRKSLLRRDNILGASRNMLASYAHRYAGAAHNLATIENAKELNAAWAGLKKKRDEYSPASDVADTIALNDKLVAARTSGTPGNRILNYISDLNSFYSLALSPAYILTNAMQVGMITTPVLAGLTNAKGQTVGFATAASYVKDAYAGAVPYFSKRGMQDFVTELKRLAGAESTDTGSKDHAETLINKFARDENEKALLNELLDRGRLDFSFLNSLQDAMRGGKAAQKFGALMRLGMAIPQQVEAMNRVVTALAAYRVATNELGMSKIVQGDMQGERVVALGDAVEFVDAIVRKTQLDYSRKNRPVLFNKPLAGMVLQFRLYTQGMYMLFVENAVKALRGATPEERKQGIKTIAYLLGTHGAIGGATGLAPVVWMAKMALAPLVFAFGDDDDIDKWKSSDDMLRSMAVDMFGKTGGRAVMNGLPTLLNIDVADRVGLPTLIDTKYAGISERDNAATGFDKTFLYLMGSPYSNARRMFGAMAEAKNGNFERAAVTGAPAGLRAAVRALTFSAKGIVDKDGDTFVPRSDLDWKDLAVTGLGLQTADVADAYRERSSKFNAKTRIGNARQQLIEDYRNAEPAERAEIRKKVLEYNKTVPATFKISYDQLTRALEAKAEREGGKKNKQDDAIDKMFE